MTRARTGDTSSRSSPPPPSLGPCELNADLTRFPSAQALTLLDYCLHAGSENVVIYFKDNLYIIKSVETEPTPAPVQDSERTTSDTMKHALTPTTPHSFPQDVEGVCIH